jgi:hypothetical protein
LTADERVRAAGALVEIMIIRMRVLAQAPSRVWIAISGTLGASTRHQLHQGLRASAELGSSELYLDLRELRCADGTIAADARDVFALGPGVRFHLVGAPAELRGWLAEAPRFIWHTDVSSAWGRWE